MTKRLILIFTLFVSITASSQKWVDDPQRPAGAMDGRTIALWQSHGRYYDAKDDRWKWQRCRLFGTVEDLYTRSYVVPFLVPMLENAGAYVMLPRERDTSAFEAIDDSPHEVNGKQKWQNSPQPGFAKPTSPLSAGQNPFAMGHARMVKTTSKADEKKAETKWTLKVDSAGTYALYVAYQTLADAVPDAHYTVHTALGDRPITINQRMGGGTWVYLGSFPFAKGEHTIVSLTNQSAHKGHISSDAVRLGGGMGSVVRGGRVSGMPRWAEAARYWLQYAGMPDSVYSHEADDYRDDIFCRPMWVNHMMQQLNVPIDLVMAFHSDAGVEPDPTTVGTLGIYYTNKGRKYADGRPRKLSGQLADSIVTAVTNDIRTLYEPQWTRRPMRDRSYIEARIPEVPTMLLELLSHQNFSDMRYGLDPQFKFDVCRAVYKGILRYMSARGMAKYTVSPLAPNSFAINSTGNGQLTLTWSATADPLEPTALPDGYIIEQRHADGLWRLLAETSATTFSTHIPPGVIHSFRVTARNSGGRSFPSEVLSAGWVEGAPLTVTVVNGFTRVAPPDNFSTADMAGFGLSDPGVPWGDDLSFTGKQYDFDRTHEWTHDDAPGFGASHADMETRPVMGNTFDFTTIHGQAIMSAGCSYVSSSAESFAQASGTVEAVDLMLGMQRETPVGRGVMPPRHKTFTPQMRTRLEELSAQGVPVFASGAYIASDMQQSAEERDFLRRIFGIELRTGHASSVGEVMEVTSRYFRHFNGGSYLFGMGPGSRPYTVGSVDAIFPSTASAATIMRYASSQSPAAVALATTSHKAVALGFPFEAIGSAASRRTFMNQIINFFSNDSY